MQKGTDLSKHGRETVTVYCVNAIGGILLVPAL